MQIREIKTHSLIGGTVDGGWPEGHEPEDDLHALVEVITDEGLSGIGSVFTNSALVQAGIETLRQHWQGESAIEPERVSEKLRPARGAIAGRILSPQNQALCLDSVR